MGSTAPPGRTDASLLSTIDVESTRRTVNGVRLHVVAAGDETDPLVVLLHGFPEFWYGWRAQIEPLVAAGYRVLVPDQRGYNLSEKPAAVRAYQQRVLARDVVELVETEGAASAHVVGHDWGGSVAWELGLSHPDVVDRLAIVNAPHPTAYREQLRSNPEQLRRSWYVMAFQLPWIPELACRATDFGVLERALRETSATGTFTEEELAHYRRAWGQDGAITGMLNWYRAAARYPPSPSRERVAAPTLVVWGEDDTALVPELAVEGHRYCDDGRLELLSETSHWVQHERPERVTDLLLDHLGN
ncbi:alpha/beta fold hydrolase [Halosolutus amylolyticus]|uniref:Alpha/beta fold hydrolase n=1 Tax=Halosolutus amylolyticus TaxID=2932267 RepID=A0ABD5PVV9_9EURY|nr:alpha/beta hydrolase [Halosolutus amylolyticus]